jgi:hypothetical protein
VCVVFIVSPVTGVAGCEGEAWGVFSALGSVSMSSASLTPKCPTREAFAARRIQFHAVLRGRLV